MTTKPPTPVTPPTSTATEAIGLSIAILQTVLSSLPQSQIVGEISTAATLITEAINKLLQVQGSDVTWDQLNSLRVTKTW